MLSLRLLGPLELSANGCELDLGGPRQRVVLAMLALNANRVTPIEQLIDAVWDNAPPTTARAQVQICISGLRRALANTGDSTQIRTITPGYLLEVKEHSLDTAQFNGLLTSARTHLNAERLTEAVGTLRSALALWRGPALAGVRSELVRRGAAKLEDARLGALIDRIRLDLALGRHEDVVGELSVLVKEHPLRERLYELLMLALYRSGRQAEALEVCREARATLMEELGIELSQSVRRLETSILNRDPTLDIEPPGQDIGRRDSISTTAGHPVVPRRLPPSIADFTGRQPQLAEIKRVLIDGHADEAHHGMRIVAIYGKGGVGKSTLALRAAHELREVYPDGHLYCDLSSPDGHDPVRESLAKHLRALGVASNDIPDDKAERVELYRSRTANKQVLVVLDGATSESQVVPLLPTGPGSAVIATSRTPLSALPGARLISIDVFGIDDGLEMLSKVIDSKRLADEYDNAVELVTLCGGLPLAIRIAGARLASRPHWRIGTLVDRLRSSTRRLDELTFRCMALRSNISLSYGMLPPSARALFRRFSLLATPDFPAWTAAPLLDIDPLEASEMVERLVEAQLLDTVQYPGEKVRYRFHDLIRVFAAEKLADEESREERFNAVERLLGAWLARAEHSHAVEYGGHYTILHGNAPRWDGARELERIDPMGEPIEWLEAERHSLVAAVHLAAEYQLTEACWDLALAAVTLFEVKGRFDEWRETANCALIATQAAGNRRGHAAMLYSLGTMQLFQNRLADAEKCFASALELFEAVGDEHGCALVTRNAATVDRMRGSHSRLTRRYQTALESMRKVGDPVGEAHILQSLAKLRIDNGQPDEAHEMLKTALDRFRQAGYLRGEAQALTRFAELYLLTNDPERAHNTLNRALRIIRDIGDKIGEAHALCRLGVARQRTGRLDNAETALQYALSLAQQTGQRMVAGQAHYTLAQIALVRGRSSACADHAELAHELFTELGSVIWRAKALILRSDVHQSLGDNDSAAEALDQAVALLDTVKSAEANRLREEIARCRSDTACGHSAPTHRSA
ncbi:DNA-binding transcriptional activator of the SARP family [Saccharomonospora marina XMU15]|uniref:DNA-binding transcriptional activator of the SARP family n=1 Tax=Saccharomonospora marina XMU15 TaxID=882083 RepID=H5XBU9_9PSEU|nr:BTAD domain-containing putative transcriptional regulator [Saccharomonospora marina]EHR52736.1 DNA-binding transcriptional activator of the SARP family [Saccharomonospora marina XMU15]